MAAGSRLKFRAWTFVGPDGGLLRGVLRPFPALAPRGAKTLVITLGGRAETGDATLLLELLQREFLRLDRWNFVLNLSYLSYLSSTALGIVLELDASKVARLTLTGASQKFLRALESVGLAADRSRGLRLQPTIKAALAKERFPGSAVLVCEMDQERVGRDAEGLTRESDLLRWASQGRLRALDLIQAQTQLDRIFEQRFEKAPSVVFPSELRYGVLLYQFLRKRFEQSGLFHPHALAKDVLDEEDLEVVVKELLENSIRHGYGGRSSGLITATTRASPGRFDLEFTDFGKGYHPGILQRALGRGGLGLQRLARLFENTGGSGETGNLCILSPSPVDPAPPLRLAREVYPTVEEWTIGSGTTIVLSHFRPRGA